MRYRSLIGLWLLTSLIASCSNDTSTQPNAGGSSSDRYFYTLNFDHLKYLPAGQSYVLWSKQSGDAGWTFLDTLGYNVHNGDSVKYSANIHLKVDPAKIDRVLLSIEPTSKAYTVPTTQLIGGPFEAGPRSAQLTVVDSSGVGRYLQTSAAITFTTLSSDTNRAKSEFYLMTFKGGKATPSAQNLPAPKSGWTYALWVVDPNFFPPHQFYYGSFNDPNGPDSQTQPGDYPLPGGYRPSPLTDPGASILLTLEPGFGLAKSHTEPSQFVLLEASLKRFINYNESIVMDNVTQSTLPTATFALIKK